jgi:hypothetical protein
MTGGEALAHLAAAGVSVRLGEDGTLRLPRTAGERFPELLQVIREHRDEALEVLRSRGAADFQHLAVVTASGHQQTPQNQAFPCVVCRAEAGPEALFCASCRAVRLERSPRLCRHELVGWDARRRVVSCATCRYEVHREGERFVLGSRPARRVT